MWSGPDFLSDASASWAAILPDHSSVFQTIDDTQLNASSTQR